MKIDVDEKDLLESVERGECGDTLRFQSLRFAGDGRFRMWRAARLTFSPLAAVRSRN